MLKWDEIKMNKKSNISISGGTQESSNVTTTVGSSSETEIETTPAASPPDCRQTGLLRKLFFSPFIFGSTKTQLFVSLT